jgi:hypothetical protein
MWRIRKPPVSECIRGKQVAELVVNFRLRHALARQKFQAYKNCGSANRYNGKPLVSCKPCKLLLDPGKDRFFQPWSRADENQANRKSNPI